MKLMTNWIKDNKLLLVALALPIIAIGLYILNFHDGVSSRQSDWGSFGDYMSIAVGLVSAYLVYITYREQRKVNHLDKFQGILKNRLSRILESQSLHLSDIELIYEKVMKHFLVDTGPIDEQEDIREMKGIFCYIFSLYYNTSKAKGELSRLFENIGRTISYIDKDCMLSRKDKKEFAEEVIFSLHTSTHALLFFYITFRSDTGIMSICEKYYIFKGLFENHKFLETASTLMIKADNQTFTDAQETITLEDEEIKDDMPFYDILEMFRGKEAEK